MDKITIVNSVVTDEPDSEPLTLAEVKEYLKLDPDFTDEDTLLTASIKSARLFVENRCNRSLIKQVRTQYMDSFPLCDEVQLLYGPLLDVSGTIIRSVKYYDTNDTLQTMSSSDYWIDSKSSIPRIVVKNSWPALKSRPNAVEIEFNCGYGTDGSAVPSDYKDAMWYYIAERYENRVPEVAGVTIGKFELTIDNILAKRIVHQNAFVNASGYSDR
jgi:uncharacterized phiE125 gp8 family phage protein